MDLAPADRRILTRLATKGATTSLYDLATECQVSTKAIARIVTSLINRKLVEFDALCNRAITAAGRAALGEPTVEPKDPGLQKQVDNAMAKFDASYATLPMIRYEIHSERIDGNTHAVDLHVAHLSFTTFVAPVRLDETKRDLDNMKNAVAAAAKVAKILATARPQCAGDDYITVEFKRTDLAEIEKLLKVKR